MYGQRENAGGAKKNKKETDWNKRRATELQRQKRVAALVHKNREAGLIP